MLKFSSACTRFNQILIERTVDCSKSFRLQVHSRPEKVFKAKLQSFLEKLICDEIQQNTKNIGSTRMSNEESFETGNDGLSKNEFRVSTPILIPAGSRELKSSFSLPNSLDSSFISDDANNHKYLDNYGRISGSFNFLPSNVFFNFLAENGYGDRELESFQTICEVLY